MLRTLQYDDEKYQPIWLTVGNPFVVNTFGDPLRIQVAFDFKTLADMDRSDKVLAICRDILSMNDPKPKVDS